MKKRILLYTAYGLCALVFFLYALFPEEKAAAYAEKTLSGMAPGYTVSLSGVSPSPPFGATLKNLTVSSAKGIMFRAESLEVSAALWPLMTGKLAGVVEGSLYGGGLKATITPLENGFSGPLEVVASFEDVEVGKMEDLWKSLGEKVSGKLAGQVFFVGDKKNWVQGDGALSLLLTGGASTFYAGFLGLETLDISRLALDSTMQDGSLTVKTLDLAGTEITGNMTGAVSLKKPLNNSRLNLSGKLSPLPELYKAIGTNSPVARILKNKAGPDGVPFVINGPIKRSNIAFR